MKLFVVVRSQWIVHNKNSGFVLEICGNVQRLLWGHQNKLLNSKEKKNEGSCNAYTNIFDDAMPSFNAYPRAIIHILVQTNEYAQWSVYEVLASQFNLRNFFCIIYILDR